MIKLTQKNCGDIFWLCWIVDWNFVKKNPLILNVEISIKCHKILLQILLYTYTTFYNLEFTQMLILKMCFLYIVKMTEKYVTNILCSTINNKNSNFTSQLQSWLHFNTYFTHLKKDLDFPFGLPLLLTNKLGMQLFRYRISAFNISSQFLARDILFKISIIIYQSWQLIIQR